MTPPVLGVGRHGLHQLRAGLERVLGPAAAPLLQEMGFAGAGGLHDALQGWIRSRYRVAEPGALEARHLGDALAGFFEDQGWGTLGLTRISDGVLALDAPDWAEAVPGSSSAPACHVSAGVFAELFSRLAGAPFAALEVECRSRGDARCRFLLAAPAGLTAIYERMTRGEPAPVEAPSR